MKATVIIPGEFGRQLFSDADPAQVQVLVDGAEPNTANFVRGYVSAIWSTFLAERGVTGTSTSAPISVEPRYWFNANAESRWFLIPGSITVIMTLIGTLLTALVVAREWERGTLEALYATPLTRGQILLGKTLPYFLLAMISTLVVRADGARAVPSAAAGLDADARPRRRGVPRAGAGAGAADLR